jgi:ketol-acid reductoisomerase
MSLPEAVRAAKHICFAFPDYLHGRVFERSIRPHLRRHQTLWFLHAGSVHFCKVRPPKWVDTILVAPHAPGEAVRREYLGERGVSAFYAVSQNYTGKAAQTGIALAKAIGVARKNLLKTTFEREAIGDLFGEQAVLCGGLAMLIKSGFEVLVDHGWKPDHAYLEVAHQLDLIVALIKKHGVAGMLARISVAAQYGSLLTGPEVIGDDSRAAMKLAFDRIQSGEFAAELANLDEADLPKLRRALGRLTDPRLERSALRFAK